MSYHTIVTAQGTHAITAAATQNTRVNITHLAVGDGNGDAITPQESQTQLVHETARIEVSEVKLHETALNWIEVNAVIPADNGGYTVREIGLYAGDTLIAVGNFPTTYKPTAGEGGAREMAIRIIIAVENASVVNVTLDNSLVYATKQWVESNFVNHNEVIDNLTSTDTDKPLSANQGKALKDGVDGLTASKLDRTGNAVSASRLATARQIALTGAVTGSVNFDGSGNVSIATALNMTEFANLKTENGYQKLPNGLILQWGDILGATNQRQIVFPIAFPNNALNVSLTLKVNSRDLDNSEAFGVFNVTNTGFSIFNWVMPSQGCYWFAIGY